MLSEDIVEEMPETINGCEGEEIRANVQQTENIESSGAGAAPVVNDNAIRVKNISELNENNVSSSSDVEAEPKDTNLSESVSGVKRKLPDWMLTQVPSTSQEADTVQGAVESISDCSSSNSKKCKLSAQNYEHQGIINEVGEELLLVSGAVALEADNAAESNENTNDDGAIVEDNEEDAKENLKPTIKIEPTSNESEGNGNDLNSAATTSPQPSSTCGTITKPPFDVKPAIKVEKADASTTSRESCRFGIRCYRRNPMHRIEEAHPGDHDYRRPQYPTPPLGTPPCPFGQCCYRRNPTHFQQYSHPPDTDFEKNYRNRLRRLSQQQQRQSDSAFDDSDLDDYDLDDPFIDDEFEDDDYMPSDDNDEDDADYDDCDKAEE